MAFTSRAVMPSGGSFPPFRTVRVSVFDLARILDFAGSATIKKKFGPDVSVIDDASYAESYARIDRAFWDAIRTGWRVRK